MIDIPVIQIPENMIGMDVSLVSQATLRAANECFSPMEIDCHLSENVQGKQAAFPCFLVVIYYGYLNVFFLRK